MKDMTPEFVRAVNLAYHEEEAADYDGRHPEIFSDELSHWERIAERIRSLKTSLGRPIKLVDLGSGTGFVPLRLVSALDERDEAVLTDMSPAMLDRAQASLGAAGFKPRASFVVTDAESLQLAAGSVDVVTMNSVVHHFPSPERVFTAVQRMLRPGGLVVIAHEPNLPHFNHPIIGNLDRFIRFLRALKQRKPLRAAAGSPFIDRVNARLIGNKIVDRPLSPEEIESVVDIHSPTAGRIVDASRGFDPFALARRFFSGYAIDDVETYRYFGKLDVAKRPRLVRAQRALEKIWPKAGALFLMILRKPEA